MDNKVGDNAPDHAKFLELLGQLRSVLGELQAFGVTLDADARKRLLRPRIGSAPHVLTVVELAKRYGLAVPTVPLAGIENDTRLALELAPFEPLLKSTEQLVADTQAQADSEAWEGFLSYYGALAALSKTIPELAVELKPVIEFMAHGKRKRPPEPQG